MITIETISKRIADEIKQTGLSQTEIAKRLGVKQQTISLYVLGKVLPSLDTFANLCEILDLDANEILGLKK